MTIVSVEDTGCFVAPRRPAGPPLQVVRVVATAPPGRPVELAARGRGVSSPGATAVVGLDGAPVAAEVGVELDADPGAEVDAEIVARSGESTVRRPFRLRSRRPGQTIHLVPHFHVDPVWWNTQAASIDGPPTSDWSGSPRMAFQRPVLDVLGLHLDRAERDPSYRFCVAEVDYLAPFWFHHPHERARMQRLMDGDRLEVVGGTYNEPSTNLTGVELTRRNLRFGLAFQRGVLGRDVASAWQLDVFGHDPGFPSVLADAGVGASVWARGPFGPWGPMLDHAFDTPTDPADVQFSTEFEWIGPDGRGVLTAYLASHYSAGFRIDRCDSVEEAAELVLTIGGLLAGVSTTRHVVVPVGTDLSPPTRWVTAVGPWLRERYLWPQVVCSLPHHFLDAVSADLQAADRRPLPQSRDMNPVYTGKDVSYIDTKQSQRATEHLLVDAEVWSTLAQMLLGAVYPHAELDEAWRLLVYGTHHDAITGTESDQVYLDLLAGWQRAHDLASECHRRAVGALAAATDTRAAGGRAGADIGVIVHDSTPGARRDIVTVTLGPDVLAPLATPGLRVVDEHDLEVPSVADAVERDDDGRLTTVVLRLVVSTTGIGRRVLHARPAGAIATWTDDIACRISNQHHRIVVDPERGGCVSSWVRADDGTELVTAGRVANEIVVQDEYPTHPDLGEGPWHLAPTGTSAGTALRRAGVRRQRSPVGERLVVDGTLPVDATGSVTYTATLTLWDDIDRVDGRVTVHGWNGADRLVRLRWPCRVRGAVPVVETGDVAIGRDFAFVEVDAATHPWTLDTPANTWCGLSVPADVVVTTGDGRSFRRAIAVAEVVLADGEQTTSGARELVTALLRRGVTATTTTADGPRYGHLATDSNAPDVRLSIGTVGRNAFSDAVIDGAGPAHRRLVDDELARRGAARVWVPAAGRLHEVWTPDLDVRAIDALPVLVVVAREQAALVAELTAVAAELAGGSVHARHPDAPPVEVLDDEPERRTVALVNRGTPGCAIDRDGTVWISLLRGSTGWPSGQWIDPPRRSAPDGTSFQLQHWTHSFEYSLLAGAGDWRDAGVWRTAHDRHHPLSAVVEPAHPGPLPGASPLVTVDPDSAVLRALHPTVRRPPGGARVVARLSEPCGRHRRVRVGMPQPMRSAHRSDLSEQAGAALEVVDGSAAVDLPPCTTTTLLLDVGPPPAAQPSEPPGDDWPTFSRWWAQGRGPFLAHGPPVALHLHRPAGGPVDRWAVTLARLPTPDIPTEATVDVDLELVVPSGWRGRLAETTVQLADDGFAVVPVELDRPADEAPGHHVIRVMARCRPGGLVHDEHIVTVAADGLPMEVLDGPHDLVVHRGAAATTTVSVHNRTDQPMWAELDVLSPWGTWDLFAERRLRVAVPAATSRPVSVRASAPVDAAAGSWWWSLRGVGGPNVVYTPTARLDVVG